MIVGVSSAIQRALVLAERYARTRLPILLVGATGTGKEVFAQHIHQRSGRPGPLVDVNCCALPRDMVESLLFGHRRGAFTGAVDSTVGHLERSDGGTLFLDELASLALEAQGKLLRALDTGEIQPLGASAKRRVDLRVIAAAQDDVGTALSTGRFRRDLFQRVAGVVIELPPLAARLEDVSPLARHFAGLEGRRLEPGVDEVLLSYSWPGNVRELRLAIERAAQLVGNGTLPPGVVAEALALGNTGAAVAQQPSDQRATLTGVYASHRHRSDDLMARCKAEEWNAARIAKSYGIARSTLYERLRSAGISLRLLRRPGNPENPPEVHHNSTVMSGELLGPQP